MFFWSYRRGAADLKACTRRYQPFVGTPPLRFSLRRGGCPAEPNQSLVSDIRHSRTREGWLYLAVEVDLFLRPLVGWSMGSRIKTDLLLDALLMALWRCQPKQAITVRADQGCQFTGQEWQKALWDHNRVSSMSWRGNCNDNAVAESLLQLLKRERIRRQVYATRNDARADVFSYIETFYNPKWRGGTAGDTLPVEFERRHSQRLRVSRKPRAFHFRGVI